MLLLPPCRIPPGTVAMKTPPPCEDDDDAVTIDQRDGKPIFSSDSSAHCHCRPDADIYMTRCNKVFFPSTLTETRCFNLFLDRVWP